MRSVASGNEIVMRASLSSGTRRILPNSTTTADLGASCWESGSVLAAAAPKIWTGETIENVLNALLPLWVHIVDASCGWIRRSWKPTFTTQRTAVLLSDGARVLTRTMKKITELTGRAGTKLRNRMRTIRHRAMEIARTSRSKGRQREKTLKQGYRKLLTVTRKVVNQAKRFRNEVVSGVKRTKDHNQKWVLEALRKDLETMLPRVQQVIRQAKARVLGGDVHVAGCPVGLNMRKPRKLWQAVES